MSALGLDVVVFLVQGGDDLVRGSLSQQIVQHLHLRLAQIVHAADMGAKVINISVTACVSAADPLDQSAIGAAVWSW